MKLKILLLVFLSLFQEFPFWNCSITTTGSGNSRMLYFRRSFPFVELFKICPFIKRNLYAPLPYTLYTVWSYSFWLKLAFFFFGVFEFQYQISFIKLYCR